MGEKTFLQTAAVRNWNVERYGERITAPDKDITIRVPHETPTHFRESFDDPVISVPNSRTIVVP